MFAILLFLFLPNAEAHIWGNRPRDLPIQMVADDLPASLRDAFRRAHRYMEMKKDPRFKAVVDIANTQVGQGEKQLQTPMSEGAQKQSSAASFNDPEPDVEESRIGIEDLLDWQKAGDENCPAFVTDELKRIGSSHVFGQLMHSNPKVGATELHLCDQIYVWLYDSLIRWKHHYDHSRDPEWAEAESAQWNDIGVYHRAIKLARLLKGAVRIHSNQLEELSSLSFGACGVIGYKLPNSIRGFAEMLQCYSEVKGLISRGMDPSNIPELIALLERFYLKIFGVVHPNPAVSASQEGGVTVLSLSVQAVEPARLAGYQKMLDQFWKTPDFRILLVVAPNRDNALQIVEQENALTSASALIGSRITLEPHVLDAFAFNHEIAHILGFPDCYFEFWDATQLALISYEVDIRNMMCSRKGKVLPIHFDALRAAYLP